MEFPYALKLMKEEKECCIRNSSGLCSICTDCDIAHYDEDMIEAFQMAIFALEQLIKAEEET